MTLTGETHGGGTILFGEVEIDGTHGDGTIITDTMIGHGDLVISIILIGTLHIIVLFTETLIITTVRTTPIITDKTKVKEAIAIPIVLLTTIVVITITVIKTHLLVLLTLEAVTITIVVATAVVSPLKVTEDHLLTTIVLP